MWAIVLMTLAASPESAGRSVQVEHVTQKPRNDGRLGTTDYAPSAAESAFFKRLAPDEVVTGGMMSDYDITRKNGVFVGWFGIVRAVTETKGETRLVVEHKYFDGMTDSHIQALDFNGSGDFSVRIPGVGHKLERLTLVKVYGTAKVGKGPPEVTAEFVRNWHWGTFTFLMAAGPQRGSENWRKENTVNLSSIYDPYPDDAYYEKRLGKR